MDRYSGRVVLVAGGSGGLGRSVSLAFLEEGAKVDMFPSGTRMTKASGVAHPPSG
jgi:NAD(P)-dependent dehydrogenase (short-subunit alcohol dehydrogenase family)